MSDIGKEALGEICIACQACCKVLYFPINVPAVGLEGLKLYATRGVDLRTINGLTVAVVEQRCRHLTNNGCSVYEFRPHACMVFDGRVDPFLGGMCKWPRQA